MRVTTFVASMTRALFASIDPVGFFRRHATADSPTIVRFPGLGEVLFFGDSQGARDILGVPSSGCVAPLPNPIEPVVGPGSLILLSGERHRRERSLMMPALHGEQSTSYAGIVATATKAELSRLDDDCTVGALDLAVNIALAIAIRVVFGIEDADRRKLYTEAVRRLLVANTTALMLVPALRRDWRGHGPWARLIRMRDDLDALLSDDMDSRRRAGTSSSDMLDILLSVTDEQRGHRTDTELHDQLRTLLAAGHETTATSLAWALHHIYRDDQVLDRLTTELSEVSTPKEMTGLPYLNAVIHETLRMHPPVPIVLRRLTEPRVVGAVPCEPGQVVGIALYSLHYNSDLWPDPNRFDPQRFLDHRPPASEYAPFGGGHRRCIGAAFAMMELAVAIGTIVTTVDLSMSEEERAAAPPRGVARGIAVTPSREITLEVAGRRRGCPHMSDQSSIEQ